MKGDKSSSISKDDSSYTSFYKADYNPQKHVHVHASQNEESNQNYLTGYLHSKKNSQNDDSNQNYLTGYLHSKKNSQNEDSSQNYLTGYLHSKKDSQNEDSNKNYLTGYLHSKKSSQNEDSNQNYLTGYLHSKKNSQNEDSGQNYLTGYLHSKKNSLNEDSSQNYLTGYLHSKKNSQNEDSNQNYLTGYLHSKTNQREMGKPYAGTYKKETKDTYAATYKVDHTEAFKTGFFTLDDLYVGNRMTLQFPIQDFPHFLSKKEADPIPFSVAQLPSLFQLFSVSEDSPQGEAMRYTLEECELETLTGETKTCVTSLESMIDFIHTIIGSESKLDILTSTLPTTSSVPLQNFTVLEISQDIYAPKWVACHPLPYPYAIFYCHFINTGSKIFKVQLGSDNGEEIEVLGMCHLDTSEWTPSHILFKQLGIKPGDAPVCHFFPMKHLMWVPRPLKAAM